MSNAILGHGTLLKRGDGAQPEVFTAIAEVKDIGGPGLTADSVEVTHQESPAGFREFIQGLKDAGEVSFDINFIPSAATHNASTGLLSDYKSGAVKNYQMVFPDEAETTWSFQAFVTGFEITAPTAEALAASVTMKITGEPTLA